MIKLEMREEDFTKEMSHLLITDGSFLLCIHPLFVYQNETRFY